MRISKRLDSLSWSTIPPAPTWCWNLQLTAPYGPTNGSKQNGASDPLPMFRLVIYDRKTHYVLWTLTESVELAFLQKTHDRNFDSALEILVDDFEALSGKPICRLPIKNGQFADYFQRPASVRLEQ